MLEHHIIPDTNIIEFVIDGKVSKEELESALLASELFIRENEQIRVLKQVKAIGAMDPSAVWDNVKWGWRNVSHITHVALVADQKWMEIWGKMASPFVSAKMKFFSSADLDQAREWLRTAD